MVWSVSKLWLLMGLVFVCVSCSGGGSGSTSQSAEGDRSGSSKDTASQSEGNMNAEDLMSKPTALVFYVLNGAFTDEEFQQFVAQPVKAKFPNITMTLARTAKGTTPEEMVSSGAQMDLLYTSGGGWPKILDLGLSYDLSGMIKSNNLDLGMFDPIYVDYIKSRGEHGVMYGLPFSRNGSAMFYNKDIFDKFGAPYPKDNMTWDEVIELAKRVARTDGGMKYHPIFTGSLFQFTEQLSPTYTDPKTDVPQLESALWKKGATYYQTINTLPNNDDVVLTNFFKEKTTALYPGVTIYTFGQIIPMYAKNDILNWDLVSYPHFPESAGRGMAIDVHTVLVSSTSKYKEQAFQVLKFITSEENQINASRNGRISGLKSDKVSQQFGQNIPALQVKHLPAIFMNTPANPDVGKYSDLIRPVITQETKNLLNGTVDVNTFLRTVNDQAAKVVQENNNK